MIFIGYKDNGYRFIRHTQGNVIFCSTQAIFDEEHFPKCPLSHSREQTPSSRLTPEIESSAPEPSGVDEPAPILFPPIPGHPRSFTPPIPPNFPTHSESPSPSLLLTLPKRSLVKIEDVEDVEIHSPSPPLRYGLRRSICETRVPHREGNVYGEDHHPTDILRRPEW